MIVASVLVALAAERLGEGKRATPGAAVPQPSPASLDVGEFVRPVRPDTLFARFYPVIRPDPFDNRAVRTETNIASTDTTPTVPASAGGVRLTAILVADDRRVAVIDDAAVSVGDVLRDGARVSAIQPDRVYVVEKDGHWRMLTLLNRGSGTK